ncbi:MAG: TIGR00282 family metallophosphoesterase [Bacillota bacterium]|jgi:metallophosphoesterase (TIGR00282 family)
MNIVFVGDVFASPGREFLAKHLPSLIEKYDADLVVANAENAAGGTGLTPEVAQELYSSGVDVLTSGNHIWDKKEILPHLDSDKRILRPANYPPGVPGRGAGIFQSRSGQTVGVINVAGRVFSPQDLDCPFRCLDLEIVKMRQSTSIVIVDFHAEATSEKIAAGYYVDGRVSALFGTHTHVQTADDRILPNGTAYITDAGMTGSYEGIIGVKREIIQRRFLTQLPVRHEPDRGKRQLNGVFCEVSASGAARTIERILILE